MIIDAIKAINSNAEATVYGNDIDTCTINWNDGTTPISKEDIKTKMAELQTAYDAKEYQRKREKEYPSIADQLDDIYHNGIDGWKATIKTTKDKYPKE
jgi:hypothetical protein